MRDTNDQLSKNVVKIALPLALQSMLGFLVNLADTIMVGRLGTVALAGVSQANQIFFIVSLTVPGIAAGASVLISQAWGKGDVERIHKVLAYAYRVALAFIIILSALVILFPEQVMRIYTPDEEAVAAGAAYLRIVAWSYFFYTVTNITTGVLRSVRTVNICLATAVAALVLNIGGNYCLIEGHFGFPALGVRGAAIATTAARIGEFLILLYYVYAKENKIVIRISKLKKLDRTLSRRFFSASIPVICNEMFWALGVSAQAIVLGRLGTEVVAANSVGSSVTQIASVICQGISAAACVLVGNTVGAGDYGRVGYLKKYFQRLAVVMGLISSALVLLLIPAVPSIYRIEGPAMEYCRQILYVNAAILLFMELQSTNMMGLLRGGGDVKFQMANDMVFLWGLTVPLGFVAAFLLDLPVAAVYACLKCDQVIKAFTSEWRLRTGNWIHDMNQDTKEKRGKNDGKLCCG